MAVPGQRRIPPEETELTLLVGSDGEVVMAGDRRHLEAVVADITDEWVRAMVATRPRSAEAG